MHVAFVFQSACRRCYIIVVDVSIVSVCRACTRFYLLYCRSTTRIIKSLNYFILNSNSDHLPQRTFVGRMIASKGPVYRCIDSHNTRNLLLHSYDNWIIYLDWLCTVLWVNLGKEIVGIFWHIRCVPAVQSFRNDRFINKTIPFAHIFYGFCFIL